MSNVYTIFRETPQKYKGEKSDRKSALKFHQEDTDKLEKELLEYDSRILIHDRLTTFGMLVVEFPADLDLNNLQVKLGINILKDERILILAD